ncbi:double-strand break repair protein AddB [Kiloniella majae]|uniref:double-strand break repair protein AddB n=1 Tax=Kiloniella majae TaxID=1938558 RepID=UPI000A277329|nr:double-strand break repair protein AddB [Kiloniella majae]
MTFELPFETEFYETRGAVTEVYSVASNASFVDALAKGILERWGDNPLEFSKVMILLPTRRACRSLQQAFLRASEGKAMMLPRMLPLGDLDPDELLMSASDVAIGQDQELDLPPVLSSLRRQLLLSQLVLKWSASQAKANGGDIIPEDQAVRLAGELGRFLDQVQTEGLSFTELSDLVPEDYAVHWQITLEFLEILTKIWPTVEEATGGIGPAERRRRLLEGQAELWRQCPPDHPLIVAGSTGSIPAAADLIGVISKCPQGVVILPGVDLTADDDTWREFLKDSSHPQNGLARLLKRLDIPRSDLQPWSYGADEVDSDETDLGGVNLKGRAPETRVDFVHMAMRPAQATTQWQAYIEQSDISVFQKALEKVSRLDCPGPGEEALAISLILRSVLETPEKTAALITPDRDLARRVTAEMERWSITIDDSAGSPLPEAAPAVFLRLTAEMLVSGLSPISFLSAMKHPLCAAGMQIGVFKRIIRQLEITVLRGVRPASGLEGLMAALGDDIEEGNEARDLLQRLITAGQVFDDHIRGGTQSFRALLDSHVEFAEFLASTDEQSGAERLWAGDDGTAAAEFVADLREAAGDAPDVSPRRYPELLAALMVGRAVRAPFGAHPRLSILGAIEARLQHADVVILGGLNEGSWPAEAKPGPWMSRPMRRDFGLPQPEQQVGLSAQDFVQAFCAPEVFLTRSEKVEGAPTVPSRWLLRIEALLEGKGLRGFLQRDARKWLNWVEALDLPEKRIQIKAPAPTPPVSARPRNLSVTRIETWMRDPYALYAQKILKLRKLDPLDADPSGADKGSLIHEALEKFLKQYPDALPEDAEQQLLIIGEGVFAAVKDRPGIWSFWWPRFQRIAKWFVEQESLRRKLVSKSHVEVTGKLVLKAPAGDFTLTAKADRIDELATGGLAILDYKTGTVPSAKNVLQGISPQLPLEAAIAIEGGFGVLPDDVKELLYWRLTGGDPAGENKNALGQRGAKEGAGQIAKIAIEGLQDLIAEFDYQETPYAARPRPNQALVYNDFEHLARIKEWSTGGEGDL